MDIIISYTVRNKEREKRRFERNKKKYMSYWKIQTWMELKARYYEVRTIILWYGFFVVFTMLCITKQMCRYMIIENHYIEVWLLSTYAPFF